MRAFLALAAWLWMVGAPAWCQAPRMPDVVGRDLVSAKQALQEAGIERFQVLRTPTRTGVDRIVRQSPLPGTAIGQRTLTPSLYLGVPQRERRQLQPPEPAAQPRAPSGAGISWLLCLATQAVVALILWRGRHLLRLEED